MASARTSTRIAVVCAPAMAELRREIRKKNTLAFRRDRGFMM